MGAESKDPKVLAARMRLQGVLPKQRGL